MLTLDGKRPRGLTEPLGIEEWSHAPFANDSFDSDSWRPTGEIRDDARLLLLAEKFNELATQWESETCNISSPGTIAKHPAILKIIKMGIDHKDEVIRLILNRMEYRPWFWFDALMQITDASENPVSQPLHGNMEAMTEAWLNWGKMNGYL